MRGLVSRVAHSTLSSWSGRQTSCSVSLDSNLSFAANHNDAPASKTRFCLQHTPLGAALELSAAIRAEAEADRSLFCAACMLFDKALDLVKCEVTVALDVGDVRARIQDAQGLRWPRPRECDAAQDIRVCDLCERTLVATVLL